MNVKYGLSLVSERNCLLCIRACVSQNALLQCNVLRGLRAVLGCSLRGYGIYLGTYCSTTCVALTGTAQPPILLLACGKSSYVMTSHRTAIMVSRAGHIVKQKLTSF